MDMVVSESLKAGLDPGLVCAVVHSLSQWMPASINHAPSDLIPGWDITPEEANNQQTTFGLFQFTGQQAREAGYKDNLTSLLDPPVNIQLGIKILKDSLQRTPKVEVGLMCYLGRSRAMLVPGILAFVERYGELISQRESDRQNSVNGPCSAGG